MKYDIGIIGAGPGGYTAALQGAKEGCSVILFEQDKVGGTCLNRGCIPTKSLLHSSSQYVIGKSLVPELSFSWQKAYEKKNETVTRLRTDIEKLIKARKVTLVAGHAQIANEHLIRCNDGGYEVENIIIATGSKVSLPPIQGIDSEYVITSNQLLENDLTDVGELVIIGGGVIGVECAGIFLDAGTKVTILEIADHILPTLDQEIAQRLNMALKKKGADVSTKVRIEKIEGNTVYYLDPKGKPAEVSADRILVAAGRKANVEGLFVEGFSLETGRGIIADKNGRTSYENIFVIGDAKDGNIQLAHVAEAQGLNAIDLIMKREPSIDVSVIPSCVYTNPEIASVGLSERQAKEQGIEVTARKVLTGSNGKSVIEEAESGYVKVVLDQEQRIIGAQMVCPHATELISEMTLLVQQKMTINQLKQAVHPHPTVAEMIGELSRM